VTEELRNNGVVKYQGEAPQEELATGERSTRNRVARSILDHGPSTVSDLAARLGLTQAAVRRHLDALAADAVVEPRDQRVYGSRGRGRPAKVFALTDCGRDAFDQSYDKLAAEALHWISTAAGGGERAEPGRRTEALAKVLSADGYAATARGAANQQGEQLCQHHCPVAHVAEQYPQLCEAETEFFSRLLGTHVQRLATIAHGDGVCTTFIPRAAASSEAPASSGTAAPPQTTYHASESNAGRNPA
jgi:predicted ArsR family transcriptional regulator